MRNLEGLEMVCFCKSKHFELEYGGKGSYVDPRGEPVDDLMDMACYVCTASYYSRESDPIPFCPSCGYFEKKRFTDQKEIAEFLRGVDWKWLAKKKLKAFIVRTMQGAWELKFAGQASELQRTGAWDKVIDLAG
ncbi:MAG: hypothetical protein JNJ59_14325 [Deltaproteobacteria bacterium]|nr:hypothetical protein [Deltaproteobacteria bacterium]